MAPVPSRSAICILADQESSFQNCRRNTNLFVEITTTPNCAVSIPATSATSAICQTTNCSFVSGAQTASWRVLGNSKYWYRDEEMSDLALNDAIAIYKETSPKIVTSHTAPSEAAREILKDLSGSYFLNNHGDVESRTSRALREMFEAHQPSAWHFGHFHINREFVIGETKFRCLAELAISPKIGTLTRTV